MGNNDAETASNLCVLPAPTLLKPLIVSSGVVLLSVNNHYNLNSRHRMSGTGLSFRQPSRPHVLQLQQTLTPLDIAC